MQILTNVWNWLVNFQNTNQFIDLAIIALVIMSGFFAKKYMPDNHTALRTLAVSAAMVTAYSVIMYAEKSIYEGYWRKMFLSYATATSLYDIIVKYAIIGFGLVRDKVMSKNVSK